MDRESNTIEHILHREHCIGFDKDKLFIKDLSLLLSGRDINDIVIIDNKITSYVINLENGIPIKDYFGDKHDKEISHLTKYLMEKFMNCSDVR